MEGLAEILSGLSVAIVSAIAIMMRKQLKNGSIYPPPHELTDTGSHPVVYPDLAAAVQPIEARLERIEAKQDQHGEQLREMGERIKGVEVRLDERTRCP